MAAASAIRASLRLSGQLPDQRSGTSVTARPDEQFAPNKPILSLFELYIAMRSCRDEAGASTVVSFGRASAHEASVWTKDFEWEARIRRLPCKSAAVKIAEEKLHARRSHDPSCNRGGNFGGVDDRNRRGARTPRGLPRAAGQNCRPVPTRRADRHPRARHRATAERDLGTAGGGGKSARRQYGDCRSARRQNAGRRLHAAGGNGCHAGAQSARDQQSFL